MPVLRPVIRRSLAARAASAWAAMAPRRVGQRGTRQGNRQQEGQRQRDKEMELHTRWSFHVRFSPLRVN